MNFQRFFKVTVLTVSAAVLAACSNSQADVASPMLPVVDVAEVIQQSVTETYEFTATTESPETVELRPRISGYIDKVYISEGSLVNEGDILFRIDQSPFIAEVNRIKADLKMASSQLHLAEKELKRAQKLVNSNAISDELLDNRLAAAQQASSRVQSITAELVLASLDLDYTEVKAPISGRVSRAQITKGNFVTAGDSALTSIVSTDRLYAYFDVSQSLYLEKAQKAQNNTKIPVFMRLSNTNAATYSGHIDFIDNHINPSTGTINVRAAFDNENGTLIPGLFARLEVIGSQSASTILVDDRAIGTDLSNKYVLVLNEDNTVNYKPVELGKKISGLRIIKSGLTASDVVVVNGLQRVRPGSMVQPNIRDMANQSQMNELTAKSKAIDLLRQQLNGNSTQEVLLAQTN